MNKLAEWLFSDEWLVDITDFFGTYEAILMVGYVTAALLLSLALLFLHDFLRGRI